MTVIVSTYILTNELSVSTDKSHAALSPHSASSIA